MKDEFPYELKFSGLKLGNHRFNWTADLGLFSRREVEQFTRADIQVLVDLEKKERMMLLQFKFSGQLDTHCDRCNQPMQQEVDQQNELVIKLAEQTDLTDDEVVFLDESEHSIDLEQFLYEFIMVGLPSRSVHPEGACDPEVERYLEEASEEEKEQKTIDPRWEALKNIKTND